MNSFYFISYLAIIIFFNELHLFEIGSSGSKLTGIDLILFSLIIFIPFLNTKKYQKIVLTKVTYILLLLIIYSLISLFNGINKNGLMAFGEYKIIFYSSFYFITLYYLDKETIPKFFKILNISAIVLVFVGYLRVFNVLPTLGSEQSGYWAKYISGDGALIVSFLLITLIIELNNEKSNKNKIYYIISIFYVGVFLYLSQVRSSLITFIISIIFYLLIYHRFINNFKHIIILLLVFIISGIVYYNILPESVIVGNLERYEIIESRNLFRDPTSLWRLAALQSTLDVIKNNIFFGQPFGDSINILVDNVTYWRFDPHNSYLYIAAKTGLIGLLIFISVILVALFQIMNLSKKSDNTLDIKLFLYLLSLSIFIGFNASLRNDSSGIMLWTILAISQIEIKNRKIKEYL